MPVALKVDDLHLSYRTINPMSFRKAAKVDGKRSAKYEALRGVSFEMEKGEIMGITGRNGGGKSTLLRTIAGIFCPDSGSIETFGQSISLLAIGVGFQPLLTGRTNILLSGLLLGFTEKQIKDKMTEIIDFSELGDFIDKPVNTYSSGMYSKLAFAITVILETDIMLIDEVLSVGDERFKKKSFEKMKSLISDENRTVLIVSHSIATLRTLCDRVMWLDEGRIVKIGDSDTILTEYAEFMNQ